jgi:ABC-type lipoprotein release transport system permease subunit
MDSAIRDLVLVGVAMVASWIPAHAATKADPLQAVKE